MKTETLRTILATAGSFLASGAIGSVLTLLDKVPKGVAGLVVERGIPAVGHALSGWTAELISVDQLRELVDKTHRVVAFDLAAVLDEPAAEAGP